MRPLNVLALLLAAAALGFFLFGILAAVQPFFKDPQVMLEQVRLITGQSPPMLEWMLTDGQWLLSFGIFLMLAFPAAILGGGAFVLWRTTGRKELSRLRSEAAAQEEREAAFQEAVWGVVEEARRSRGLWGETIARAGLRLLPDFDPPRQARLRGFFSHLGVLESPIDREKEVPASGPSASERRQNLARLIGFLCFLGAFFMFLWGITSLLHALLMPTFEELFGLEFTRADAIFGLLFCWIFAILGVFTGWGFLRLGRLENEFEEIEEEGRRRAQARALESYRLRVEGLELDRAGAEGRDEIGTLLRAWTAVNLPLLDGEGKGALLRQISTLGSIGDGALLDLQGLDFRDAEATPEREAA